MATRVSVSRKTAVAAHKKRRRRRRRGKMTLHYIFLLFFLLAAGITLSLTVFFEVENISVIGTDKYTQEEIIATSGLQVGENLFRTDLAAAKESVQKAYPYVESVDILRKFPPGFVIDITQSMPAGALAWGDEYILITRTGKVLERGTVFIPMEIPLIKGIQVGTALPGEYLDEQGSEGLVMLEYLLKAMEETGFTDITNVDISDRLNMQIIYENRLILKLGSEADLPYKLRMLQAVIENNLGPEEQGVLDASMAPQKKRSVFKAMDIHAQDTSEEKVDNPIEEELQEGDTAPQS